MRGCPGPAVVPLPSLLLFYHSSVSVHLGCYNKIPQTGWPINSRHLSLTVVVAGSPRSGCQHGCFQVADFSLYPHTTEEARTLSGTSSTRALILFMRALLSWYNHLPKAASTNTTILGSSDFNICILRGHRHSKHHWWGCPDVPRISRTHSYGVILGPSSQKASLQTNHCFIVSLEIGLLECCIHTDFCYSNYLYKHTSFYCAMHYCTSQILHFLQIKGLWQSSVEQVYQCCFSNSICSLHVSVSHFDNFHNIHNISNFFIIIIFVMVICDQ